MIDIFITTCAISAYHH